jgi:hypothetical protein
MRAACGRVDWPAGGRVSNVDNLAVGLAFGMRLVRIPASTNAIIAAITTAATAAAMTLGHTLARSIARTRQPSSALLIMAIGAWTLVASLATLRPDARRSTLADLRRQRIADRVGGSHTTRRPLWPGALRRDSAVGVATMARVG